MRPGETVPHPGVREAGGATVLAVCAWALTLVLALAVASVATAVRCGAQARAAADLGALAAADALLDKMRGGAADPRAAPADGPCAAAGAVAAGNGARLESCVVDGGTNVTVSVSVVLGEMGRLLPGGQAFAVARAGPAPPSS